MQLITPVKPAHPVEQRLHRGGCLSAGGRDFGAIRAKSHPPGGRAGYPSVQTRDRVTVGERWPTGPTDAGTGPKGADTRGCLSPARPKNHKAGCFRNRLGNSGGGIRTRDLRVMSPTSYQAALPRNQVTTLGSHSASVNDSASGATIWTSFAPLADGSAMPEHLPTPAAEPLLADPALEVRWQPALLEASHEQAVDAFQRAIHGFARRLSPHDGARFLLALDSAIYSWIGESAIRAERAAGRNAHPKHRLIDYHAFFLDHINPGETVLDLGCGWGVLAARIAAERSATVIGVDLSDANLQRARSLGLERTHLADILDLASGAETLPEAVLGAGERVDAIILSNVLEHLPERPRVLSQLSARFAGARLLIRVPAFDRDWRVPFKREMGVEWRLDVTHEIEHTEAELRGELEAAGLAVTTLERRWGEFYAVALPG